MRGNSQTSVEEQITVCFRTGGLTVCLRAGGEGSEHQGKQTLTPCFPI